MPSQAAAPAHESKRPGWYFTLLVLVVALLGMCVAVAVGDAVGACALGVVVIVQRRELDWYPANPGGRIPRSQEHVVHFALMVLSIALLLGLFGGL